MVYLLLVLLNLILAFSLFSWKRQICEITKQISENKKLRISLSNKQIEKLKEEIKDMDAYVRQDMDDDKLRDEDIFRINEKMKELERQIINVIEG